MRGAPLGPAMVVTTTDNPMNESDDGPMRLGDDVDAPKKGKGKNVAADEDDGGWESTAHFMDDVFGEWLNDDDTKEMSFQDLMEWSEVGHVTCSALHPQCAHPFDTQPACCTYAPPHARGLTYWIVTARRRSSVWI